MIIIIQWSDLAILPYIFASKKRINIAAGMCLSTTTTYMLYYCMLIRDPIYKSLISIFIILYFKLLTYANYNYL